MPLLELKVRSLYNEWWSTKVRAENNGGTSDIGDVIRNRRREKDINPSKLTFKESHMISKFKKIVKNNRILLTLIKPIYFLFSRKKNFNSKKYWEARYIYGGNSGAGSYGRLAKFKADVINDFVKTNEINTVIEFGCGDGHQLSLFKIPYYTGFDVSKKSISLCKDKFISDKKKSFFLYGPQYFIDNAHLFQADLTLSLDVIYHLIEDDMFKKYMYDLFASSKKYVIIYSSNTDKNDKFRPQHVRHRKFTDFIKNNYLSWSLISEIKNEFPLKNNEQQESFADFYIYEKNK